jgi:hypothetical protein
MIYSYDDCIEKYGNQYQLNKEINSGRIGKIEPGIYADSTPTELEIITFKYPAAIFTMDSAFYYHGLTDVVPDLYHLATSKDAAKIKSPKVKQYFHRDDKFKIGLSYMEYQGIRINIYDQERMLIELIRNKNSLPFDYYKEIIESYRRCVNALDIEKLQGYISFFPTQNHIFNCIQLEVF